MEIWHQSVAVIGPPNSGKSLLTNQLVKAQVSAVSSKMDTTQRNVTAALTEHDCQLIVIDSPGTVGINHARKVVKRNEPMLLIGIFLCFISFRSLFSTNISSSSYD
ncbi:unnamed protein product [Anisakis simplex]|uniref:Uncharacterized GTP-binding protein (inferred by orthology to a C. elegans protein) n=1 Tax=Anisakis simplex TaxID=6269 RepID=A0A0M3JKW5_ANISI|nr:unnamed protein product [Anisakis simplex]